jgi:hypothetical protein
MSVHKYALGLCLLKYMISPGIGMQICMCVRVPRACWVSAGPSEAYQCYGGMKKHQRLSVCLQDYYSLCRHFLCACVAWVSLLAACHGAEQSECICGAGAGFSDGWLMLCSVSGGLVGTTAVLAALPP